MKYKLILLDLDNTLYDYNVCHDFALKKTLSFLNHKLNIEMGTLNLLYQKSRKLINTHLINTASSHSRLLYFKTILDDLKLNNVELLDKIDDLYWETYFEKLVLHDGVKKFFELYAKKICFLTDFTLKIQIKKIYHLGILSYTNNIVSSEEVGCEKPNKKMFLTALKKFNCLPNDACMIGDNFYKDILGASKLNIDSIWINRDNLKPDLDQYSNKNILELKNFNDIFSVI